MKKFRTIDLENVSVEELLAETNIQHHLTALLSKDSEKVKTSLHTLAAAASLGKRRDSLYALVGYYELEVNTLEEIQFFFKATRSMYLPDLVYRILRDISQRKEVCRQKLFLDEVRRVLSTVVHRASPDQVESFRALVETAVWGDKLKFSFFSILDGIDDY